jgi:hypothetical protein
MVDLQAIGLAVTATSVVVGIIYYIFTARTTLQTRQAQLFMQVYSKWQEKEFNLSKQLVLQEYRCVGIEDYEEVLKDKEKAANFRVVSTALEGLGVLVKRGLVDVGIVDDMMSGDVIGFWEKYGGAVKEFRVRLGYPQALEWTEYLYNEVKSLSLK